MRPADILTCTAIIDDGLALGKRELLGRLVILLAEAGYVAIADVSMIQEALLRRETLGSTGIGRGLAIPHTKHPSVTRPLGVLAVCRPPVEFDALDGEVVHIIALILFPTDRPGQHLGEASRGSEGLLRCLADERFGERVRQAGSPESLMEIVREEGDLTRR